MLSKVIAPYPISAPVADIASEALAKPGLGQMNQRVLETNTLRAHLATWLVKQSWCSEVFSSDANFILFRCQNNELKDFIFNCLVENDILIRDQSKQQNLENCLRISIGSERELSLLQQTITQSFTNNYAAKATAETLSQEN